MSVSVSGLTPDSGVAPDASGSDSNGIGSSDSSSPGGDGAGDYSDGGKIMKDPDDPKGVADDILISVSGGETIVPTDVTEMVEAMHPGFFKKLSDMFHTPSTPPGTAMPGKVKMPMASVK